MLHLEPLEGFASSDSLGGGHVVSGIHGVHFLSELINLLLLGLDLRLFALLNSAASEEAPVGAPLVGLVQLLRDEGSPVLVLSYDGHVVSLSGGDLDVFWV